MKIKHCNIKSIINSLLRSTNIMKYLTNLQIKPVEKWTLRHMKITEEFPRQNARRNRRKSFARGLIGDGARHFLCVFL